MYLIVRSVLLISFLFFSSGHAVVILVHGSFALNADWCKPGGDFYEELQREARRDKQCVVPFLWSGSLGVEAKVQAAQVLAQLILSYPPDEQIILIGHSHGGNVITLATQFIAYAKAAIADAEFGIPPLRACSRDSFCSIDSKDCGQIDWVESTCWSQEEQDVLKNACVAISDLCVQQKGTRFWPFSKEKEYLIDRIYLLATPVDQEKFAPNMDIVLWVYNLYSTADYVQGVLGWYEKKYSGKPRIVNLQVLFKGEDGVVTKPGHLQLHDAIISRWLLSIPDRLRQERTGGFDTFDQASDAYLYFSTCGVPPEYSILSQALAG